MVYSVVWVGRMESDFLSSWSRIFLSHDISISLKNIANAMSEARVFQGTLKFHVMYPPNSPCTPSRRSV